VKHHVGLGSLQELCQFLGNDKAQVTPQTDRLTHVLTNLDRVNVHTAD